MIDWKKLKRVYRGSGKDVKSLSEEEIKWVTKKYFGIGLGKTGTLSLHYAMWELGFRSTHGIRYIDAIHDNQFANDIAITCRYKFLDYCFPDAKFILTVRDLDAWLKSSENHRPATSKEHAFYDEIPLVNIPLRRAENRFMLYGITYYDRDVFIKTYHKFHWEVVEHFKGREDKLLILDICNGEGWEKLCPFIGKPIPDIPFPHQNKGNYQDG